MAESEEWAAELVALIRRGLLAQSAEHHAWVRQAIVTWRDVEWGSYVRRTQASFDTARRDYNQAMAEALGRVLVYAETNHDTVIAGTLAEIRRQGISEGHVVVDVLKLRFANNDVPDSRWNAIATRVDAEPVARGAGRLLTSYRREL